MNEQFDTKNKTKHKNQRYQYSCFNLWFSTPMKYELTIEYEQESTKEREISTSIGKTRRLRIRRVATWMKCESTIEYEKYIIKNDINIRNSIHVSQHVSNINGRFDTSKTLEKTERDRYPYFNLSFVINRSSMNAIIPHTKAVSVRKA